MLLAVLLALVAIGGAIVGGSLLRADATVPMGGGAVFAFSSVAPDAQTPQNVMTIRADGTDVRQLTGGGANRRLPQFSPDGTRIAVRQWQAGIEPIVVMDAGGGSVMTLATYPVGVIDCIGQWQIAWSPDGSALAYARRDGCSPRSQIDIVGTDGTPPPVPLLGSDLDATSPSWSPDGTQVAFSGRESAGPWGVYVADVELPAALEGGLVPRQIGATLGVLGGDPAWSPDGSELAVTDHSSGNEFEGDAIHVIKADDSGSRKVVDRAHNPGWSPDGTRLSFARTVDPSEYWNGRPCTVRIGTVKVDGTDERLLDPSATAATSPRGIRPTGPCSRRC